MGEMVTFDVQARETGRRPLLGAPGSAPSPRV
jgi:hypothetical protein